MESKTVMVHYTTPFLGRGVHHRPWRGPRYAPLEKHEEAKWRVPFTRPSTYYGGHHDQWRILWCNPSLGSFKAAKERPINGPRPPPRNPHDMWSALRAVEGSLKGTLGQKLSKISLQASLRSYEVRVFTFIMYLWLDLLVGYLCTHLCFVHMCIGCEVVSCQYFSSFCGPSYW